jgi:hypothetical protein
MLRVVEILDRRKMNVEVVNDPLAGLSHVLRTGSMLEIAESTRVVRSAMIDRAFVDYNCGRRDIEHSADSVCVHAPHESYQRSPI